MSKKKSKAPPKSQPPDPEKILQHADRYHRVERILNNAVHSDPDAVLWVLPVFWAFEIELYLKCILWALGKTPWGHELEELFDQVTVKELQNEIIRAWARATGRNYLPDEYVLEFERAQPEIGTSLEQASWSAMNKEFRQELARANKQFSNWRYAYEGFPGSGNVQHIIPSLRAIAQRLVAARKL